jgi:hypothetical protein
MAEVLKFGKKATPRGEEIPAALREFIDAVIIPALLKEYLAETDRPNVLVLSDDGMANSATRELPSEGVLR